MTDAQADAQADRKAYAAGLHAADYGAARDACGDIEAAGLRGDCLVAAMERHGRLEVAECDAIGSELWREECRFLFAERAARAGKHAEALAACASTRFARSCSYHLIRQAVDRQAGASIEAAAREAAGLPEMPLAPDAMGLFWRDWWRAQLRGGGEIDARRCPPTPAVAHPDRPTLPACEQGAREALEGIMEIRIKTRPAGTPCAAPPNLPWPDAEPMRGWAAGVAARSCLTEPSERAGGAAGGGAGYR